MKNVLSTCNSASGSVSGRPGPASGRLGPSWVFLSEPASPSPSNGKRKAGLTNKLSMRKKQKPDGTQIHTFYAIHPSLHWRKTKQYLENVFGDSDLAPAPISDYGEDGHQRLDEPTGAQSEKEDDGFVSSEDDEEAIPADRVSLAPLPSSRLLISSTISGVSPAKRRRLTAFPPSTARHASSARARRSSVPPRRVVVAPSFTVVAFARRIRRGRRRRPPRPASGSATSPMANERPAGGRLGPPAGVP
jgi:hypothetical protein